MDINSLLSPSDTPRSVSSTPNSPQPSPFKFTQRTQSGPGSSKHGYGVSPLSQSVMYNSSIPAHIRSPTAQQASSPLISPVPATNSSQLARTISTTSIDTLADLASMHGQVPRSAPSQVRSREGYEMSRSPTLLSPAVAASLTSNPRASFDINMMETPKQNARTDFSDTSIPTKQQARLRELTNFIQENPSSYESHIEVIKILHQGFIDHIYPPDDSNTRRDPSTYDLLSDLRNARENMENLFGIGEELWIDWLQDESILAHTAEERIAVVESCRRAVEEETGSVSLWLAYGDWVRHCHNWAHDAPSESDAKLDEERMVGRELFTWQMVMDTWQEAVDQTALNLSQSHLVWDKYLELRLPDLEKPLESGQVSTIMALFEQRLLTPHATWDETFQRFSSFVTTNFPGEKYEHIMSIMLRSSTPAKKKFAAREAFETAISQALESQDRRAEYSAFVEYLQWEQTPEKRKKVDADLVVALFQRAELRFPSDATLWEEHIAFLLYQAKPILLPILEQATKHCPWSGSLWSQYLLSSDKAGQTFQETESIKHKATSTGLLDAAGIEEVIKVHAAWCSYLRRRSFRPDSSEEDLDVAEMGIRSSIENVASLGAKLGLEEVSDPAFRLHRIYIVFLSESGRWDNARQELDNSIRDYGGSWEFWMLFYHWEMGRWRRFASNQQNSADEPLANIAAPHMATAVLKQALDQPNLDYPEPIMQALVTHCEDFEDAEELQSAMLKVQQLRKAIVAKQQSSATTAEQSAPTQTELPSAESSVQHVKRKRDDEIEENSNKKMRNEEIVEESVEQTDHSVPKRNRENATILVENLPDDISDTRIRQYFSNCGDVRALKVLREDGVSAIVEFENDDDAKYALSRDEQDLDGAILSVSLDTGSTLYLTNYKPSADEAYIRNILGKYGDILSIRFPSLQGNKKRRFCYVQFKLPADAQAASAGLDNLEVDEYTLTCKISNPAHRQTRQEVKVNDGHTIFIGQLNFKATEDELREVFAEYGSIEKIRMPLHQTMKNRNKGIAYITYNTIEQAERAASGMNGHNFKDRNLTVELAVNRSLHPRKQEASARSATPKQNGDRASIGRDDGASRRERQVFLSNVPDTVNEARIREVAEKFGKLIRVILKTNHQGAILEYSESHEAGQAALALEGHEIAPERQIRVVSENEMLSGTRERKVDGFAGNQDKSKAKFAPPITGTVPVRRPQQPGMKKGGNLGQRYLALHQSATKQEKPATANEHEGGKSNDDFRAMLTKTTS